MRTDKKIGQRHTRRFASARSPASKPIPPVGAATNSRGSNWKIKNSHAGTAHILLNILAALGASVQFSAGRFPLEPFLEAMYLARCNNQLGEQTASANNWQRALEAAQGDARKLIIAYNNAAAITPRLRLAHDGRLRMAQASRDTKKIHAVLATMLALWPDDLAIQNDEAYTRLLLCPPAAPETKDQAAAIEKLAEKLIEREPHSLPHRTLLALARLRQERAEEALRVYSDLQVKQDAVSGSALAVHAAILAATANLENAKTEAAQLKREQLLPEEQALVKGLPGS